MFGGHEELIEGLRSLTTHDDADREVHSFTRKKVPTPPPGTIEYLVSGSESLASIAAKHKSTTSELVKINKLMSTLVYPGQRLFVPTEDYVPIGYGGSQASSPRTSPKLPPRCSDPVGGLDVDPARQRRISLDESKRTKKVKNRVKERRPSDIFPGRRKSVTTNQRDVRFSTRVDYVTGEKDPHVSGVLQITLNEVNFEPDVLGNDRDLLKDLVRYRMSLGKAMVAANIVDQNPYSKISKKKREEEEDGDATTMQSHDDNSSLGKEKSPKQPHRTRKTGDRGAIEVRRRLSTEKVSDFWNENESKQRGISFGAIKDVDNEDEENEENKDENEAAELMKYDNETEKDDVTASKSPPSSSSPVPERYLLVKLGIPTRAVKERPTISSLIRRSLPVTETVTIDHCFLIPNDTVAELTVFLRINYPDAFGKTDIESLERFDVLDNLNKQTDSKNAKQFLRTLSVAELCNLPLPEMSTESSILTETHVRILREHLLTSAEGRPWNLVYSSNLHGYSIGTLYRSMASADMSSTLLLIADMENKVFGAMLSNSIRQSEGFYGNGETFLFTFHPVFKKFCWSGKNSYFLRGTPDNFYIGASDGVFGLWLHDDLDHGRTQRCETFDNDPLTAESEDFNIRCVEIWQFPFSLNR